ncbi:MAG: TraB/GumN family protein [Steroidobacteraceae bacterium]|nr:TraB/GumN family protein [Steroidobacteraceae bacterium]
MRKTRRLEITLLLLSGVASASDPATSTAAPDVDKSGLAVVLVMGEQPGPGLWQVSSGQHVPWILGEVSPIPRRVQWKSQKFDKLLRNSQELLLNLSGSWHANAVEMSAYRQAEKLPRGTALKDVISPKLHGRLKTTARKFGAFELEELRPFSAKNRLVVSAMRTLGLKGFSARADAEDLAKKRDIRITYGARWPSC